MSVRMVGARWWQGSSSARQAALPHPLAAALRQGYGLEAPGTYPYPYPGNVRPGQGVKPSPYNQNLPPYYKSQAYPANFASAHIIWVSVLPNKEVGGPKLGFTAQAALNAVEVGLVRKDSRFLPVGPGNRWLWGTKYQQAIPAELASALANAYQSAIYGNATVTWEPVRPQQRLAHPQHKYTAAAALGAIREGRIQKDSKLLPIWPKNQWLWGTDYEDAIPAQMAYVLESEYLNPHVDYIA